MNSIEKRRFIRAKVDFPVKLEFVDEADEQLAAKVVDISVDGILLEADSDMEVGKTLLLDLPPEWGEVSVLAKILRRNGNKYGCQFPGLGLQPMLRKALDESIYRWRCQANPPIMSGLVATG